MTDTSGFYKNEDGNVLHGHDLVYNANYCLNRDLSDQYEYPIDGWYWFDSIQDAYSFFGIDMPQEQINIQEGENNG
jgi:hypothetical protein